MRDLFGTRVTNHDGLTRVTYDTPEPDETREPMKAIRVTQTDGSRWDVPARLVAANRATYYASKEGEVGSAAYQATYEEEFAFTMGDEYELLDWAAGNMNWSDVADSARRVPDLNPEEPDWEEGWMNGDKKIVEVSS